MWRPKLCKQEQILNVGFVAQVGNESRLIDRCIILVTSFLGYIIHDCRLQRKPVFKFFFWASCNYDVLVSPN